MDEWQFERAAKLEEQERASALAKNQKELAPQTHPDFDGVHCVESDCGEPIPQARLALGKIRCVDCQSRRER
jgi:RNA polymerase-binding transcription factor DksA